MNSSIKQNEVKNISIILKEVYNYSNNNNINDLEEALLNVYQKQFYRIYKDYKVNRHELTQTVEDSALFALCMSILDNCKTQFNKTKSKTNFFNFATNMVENKQISFYKSTPIKDNVYNKVIDVFKNLKEKYDQLNNGGLER